MKVYQVLTKFSFSDELNREYLIHYANFSTSEEVIVREKEIMKWRKKEKN